MSQAQYTPCRGHRMMQWFSTPLHSSYISKSSQWETVSCGLKERVWCDRGHKQLGCISRVHVHIHTRVCARMHVHTHHTHTSMSVLNTRPFLPPSCYRGLKSVNDSRAFCVFNKLHPTILPQLLQLTEQCCLFFLMAFGSSHNIIPHGKKKHNFVVRPNGILLLPLPEMHSGHRFRIMVTEMESHDVLS